MDTQLPCRAAKYSDSHSIPRFCSHTEFEMFSLLLLASYAFPICTNIIYTLVVSQTNNYFHGFVVVGGDGGGSGGEGGGSGPANCCTYFSVIMQQI